MKKRISYTIGSVIILIICVIAFVLPSTLGSGGNTDGIVFGKYDNKKINYTGAGISDFDRELANFYNMIQGQGGTVRPEDQFFLFNYAFNSTVMKYANQSFVSKAGYKAPSESVSRIFQSYFKNSEGKIDTQVYNSIPEEQKADMVKQITDDLTEGRFRRDVLGSEIEVFNDKELYGLKTSSKESDFFKNYSKEKRGFHMAAFSKLDYPIEEKINFGKKNAAKFNKYDLSVITVSDKSEADKVATRLNNSEITFEDAITEYSNKNYTDSEGVLTNAFQYQIENIIYNVEELSSIIDLQVDSISPVIQTKTGYSIFKMNTSKIEPDFESDEILSRISSYINNYEASMIEDYFVAKAKDFKAVAVTSDFDSACEKANATKVDIAPFPLNYGSVSIGQSLDTTLTGLAGADENEAFLKTAFSLNMNELSDPIVLHDYIVVIQYYTNEDGLEDKTTDLIENQLGTFDEELLSSSIMTSSKLENNFQSVYYNQLMNY